MAVSPNFRDVLINEERAWKKAHLPGHTRDELNRLGFKSIGKQVAQRLGLPMARTLFDGPLRAALSFATQLDRFTIKPEHAAGSVGVRCLINSDGLYNVLSGKRMSAQELNADLIDTAERKHLQDRWVIEDMLVPPDASDTPLDDFKFYCFHGEVACILHKKNIWKGSWRARYKWFDSDWREVDVGKYNDKIGADMEPPSSKDALLAMARQASLGLPVPFMRVDLYDTSRGPVFGEFTPRPGEPDKFSAEWDRILRRHWFEAARRIILTHQE